MLVRQSWEGNIVQELEGEDNKLIMPCRLNFTKKFRRLTAELNYNTPEYISIPSGKLILKGGFYKGQILKMDYRNIDSEVLQYGTFYIEIGTFCKELSGRFCGYGPLNKMVIHGKIFLNTK